MLKSIKSGTPGFGICFDICVKDTSVQFEGLGCVSVSGRTTSNIRLTTKLATSADQRLLQSCQATNNSNTQQSIRYHVNLGMSINRASFGQLTEGGPIPLPLSRNELVLVEEGFGFIISNRYLGARLQGTIREEGQILNLTSKLREGVYCDELVDGAFSGEFNLDPGSSRSLEAEFVLKSIQMPASSPVLLPILQSPKHMLWKKRENQAQFIVRRNLEYILGNCAVPIPSASNAICLITDHVALPLGWNRDNL